MGSFPNSNVVVLEGAFPRGLSEAEFFELCQENPDLRMEREAHGEITIMSPVHTLSSYYESEVLRQLSNWHVQNGRKGLVLSSSGGITLPNGAVRSPDAAWISPERAAQISLEDRRRFAHVAPDFVVELLSPSDALSRTQAKMEEYIAQGVRLGWLIHPDEGWVAIYRPGNPITYHRDFSRPLSAAPELPGFIFSLSEIGHPLI